jgi:UDP-glucose 4-epimerase
VAHPSTDIKLTSTIRAPRRALVVGAGFIGTHVARGFVRRGVHTTLLARRRPAGASAARVEGAELVLGDAIELAALESVLDGIDHVAWCAGGLMPAESNERPVQDVGTTLPPLLGMLEALEARGSDCSLSFLSSGGTVYGNPSVLPVPEHHSLHPVSSHGVTKVAAELYLSMYRELYGLRTVALRCGNVYGAGQQANRSQGIVANALHRVLHGEVTPMYGDGGAVRDYVYVDDVVDVVCTLAGRADIPPVLNVGTAHGTSIAELLSIIGDVTGLPVRTEVLPARPGDVSAITLDITLLRSLMAYEPVQLADGIARTWADLVGDEQAATT